MDVVEDQHRRALPLMQPGCEAWDGGGKDAIVRRGERRPERSGNRFDTVQRGGQVGEQHDRVVVEVIKAQPGDRPSFSRCPLRKQGRLPVPGRRDHGDDRTFGSGADRVKELGSLDRRVPGNRRVELGLHQRDRGLEARRRAGQCWGPITVIRGAGLKGGPAYERGPILAGGIWSHRGAGIGRGNRHRGGAHGMAASSAASTS